MRQRDRATYLVLLEVGAIEDHMTPGGSRRARAAQGRGTAEPALQPPARTRDQGGLTR